MGHPSRKAWEAQSSCPHHFCPCGVVQPTRLCLKQEITGAKPVRDANSEPPKHSQRCASSVRKRAWCNSGWGLHRSRASAQAGFIRPLCPGQHWRLRPAFARSTAQSGRLPRRSPLGRRRAASAVVRAPSYGSAGHCASWQQPAGFLCKKAAPGRHRQEAPFALLL